jgi:hypothetical protein
MSPREKLAYAVEIVRAERNAQALTDEQRAFKEGASGCHWDDQESVAQPGVMLAGLGTIAGKMLD